MYIRDIYSQNLQKQTPNFFSNRGAHRAGPGSAFDLNWVVCVLVHIYTCM